MKIANKVSKKYITCVNPHSDTLGSSPAVAGFLLFSFLSQQAGFQSTFVFVIRLLIYNMIIYDSRLDEVITPTKTK